MKNKYALHSQKCPKWPFLEVFFDAFLNARLQGPKNMIFGFSMKFPFRRGMSRPYLKIFFFRPLESIFFPLVPVTVVPTFQLGSSLLELQNWQAIEIPFQHATFTYLHYHACTENPYLLVDLLLKLFMCVDASVS